MSATDVREETGHRVVGPERMARTGWRWRDVRYVAFALYAVGLLLFIRLQGVPTDRLGIYGGILIFLTIVTLGRGWLAWWQMIIDWMPFQMVLLAYDYSRGYASPYSAEQVKTSTYPIHDVHNSLGLPLHVMEPIHFDQWFGRLFGLGGEMPTTWVQEHFHPHASIPLIGVFVALVYCSHFLVMPIVAVVLWIRNRPRFLIWMRMVMALAVAGVTTYFLYPMAPPWLADAGGVFPGPTMGRYTTEGFDLIHLHMVGGMVSQGQYLVNPVAAMPSLHTAYATLAAGFFWFGKRWWQKALLACYPFAMGFALLYGGEHYVADEIAGAAYALVIIACWRLLRRRRIRQGRVVSPDPTWGRRPVDDRPEPVSEPEPASEPVSAPQAGYDASSANVGRSG